MLRRIPVPNREEVAGGYRRQHNEELYNLNSSKSILSVWANRGGWDAQTFSNQGGDEKCVQNFGRKNL